MKKYRVAIHVDDGKIHSGHWSSEWARCCELYGIKFEFVNCYKLESIRDLNVYDAIFWHFTHYSKRDMIFARSILNSAKALGLKVFPDTADAWHFDDKVAQDYYLHSLGISAPDSLVLFSYESVLKWLEGGPDLPVVAKLRCGSGSQNVKLLESKKAVLKYADKMFKKGGFSTVPSIAFKTKSNVLSLKSFSDVLARTKRIPDFANTLKKSKSLDKESDYFYIQSLIVNTGFDLKIVVVGNKLSFIGRRSRGSDFRASGGGDLFYNKELVTRQVIDLCFSASDKIGASCMGYDVVIDKDSGIPYIIEMSYGFSHVALLGAGGYWNREHYWVNEPLNAPEEILKNTVKIIDV
jgi:glutathione synthase/RimK-type ligase-like ATP-grasp enzyme